MPIVLDEVARFLDDFFHVHQYASEGSSLVQPSDQPVRRIGLALEPWADLTPWAAAHDLDALFLHRPRALSLETLPAHIGVVSHHLAFDDRLTLGFNLRLADALGMSALGVLGRKEGRPIGMIGTVRKQTVAEFFRQTRQVFGGYEEAHTCEQDCVSRVAVVGAMNKSLVHQAADRGADVYVTGQYRQPGRIGVLETGIGVIIVGHDRSEAWGLGALAGLLRERWAGLEVVLPPHHESK